jgi:predicted transcriptional regulator
MKTRDTKADDMVTTSISFDRATYKQLGHLAVEEEIPVRDLIRRAVEEYLHRHQKGGKP